MSFFLLLLIFITNSSSFLLFYMAYNIFLTNLRGRNLRGLNMETRKARKSSMRCCNSNIKT